MAKRVGMPARADALQHRRYESQTSADNCYGRSQDRISSWRGALHNGQRNEMRGNSETSVDDGLTTTDDRDDI